MACAASLLSACSESDLQHDTAGFRPGEPMAFNIAVGEAAAATRGHSANENYDGGYALTGEEVVAVSVKTTSPANTYRASTADVKQYKVTDTDSGALTYQQKGTYNTATTEDVQHYWLSPTETATIEAWSWGTDEASLDYHNNSGANAGTIQQIDHPSGKQFTLQTNQDVADVRELLYMPPTARTYTDNKASNPINLYHQLARVVVKVQFDGDSEEYNNTTYVTAVTGCTFGSNGSDGAVRYMPISAVWTAPTTTDSKYGTWTSPQGATTTPVEGWRDVITMRDETPSVTGRPSAATPKIYSAVVLPLKYVEGLTLFVLKTSKSYKNPGGTANISDDYYAYHVPSSGDFTGQLEPGKQYTFTLTLTDTGVKTNVTITDWGVGGGKPATENYTGDQYTVGNTTFRMIRVKGTDAFSMTMYNKANTTPVTVTGALSDYYISETEVSVGLYDAVMNSSTIDDNQPKNALTYPQILAFINELNNKTEKQRPAGWRFTLPSEMQWQWAAQGGVASQGYTYIGTDDASKLTTSATFDYAYCESVRDNIPNELGIYNMAGGVTEPTIDRYHAFSNNTNVGRDYVYTAASGDYVYRGGSNEWRNAGGLDYYQPGSRNSSAGTVAYNNSGIRLCLRRVQVGDLYFSDGTWGSAAEVSGLSGKTPIGIVFSTETSQKDQALGFQQGYVMALDEVTDDITPWATASSTPATTVMTGNAWSNAWSPDATAETIAAAIWSKLQLQSDMDGLTNCRAALASNGGKYDNMNAIKAAMQTYGQTAGHAAPATSSGWYLPSAGQQLSYAKGLCKANLTGYYSTLTQSNVWTNSGKVFNMDYSDYDVSKAMNTYITACLGSSGSFTSFAVTGAGGHVYYSSTEIDASTIMNNHLVDKKYYMSGNHAKDAQNSSYTYHVRPVLAF